MTHRFTLKNVRDSGPGMQAYRNLCRNLIDEYYRDTCGYCLTTTDVTLGDVLISNGRMDALWCLQFLPVRAQLDTVMPFLKRGAALISDKRVHNCIAVLDKWRAGDDSVDINGARNEITAMLGCGYVRRIYGVSLGNANAVASAVHSAAGIKKDSAPIAAQLVVYAYVEAARPAERELQAAEIIKMHPPIQLSPR